MSCWACLLRIDQFERSVRVSVGCPTMIRTDQIKYVRSSCWWHFSLEITSTNERTNQEKTSSDKLDLFVSRSILNRLSWVSRRVLRVGKIYSMILSNNPTHVIRSSLFLWFNYLEVAFSRTVVSQVSLAVTYWQGDSLLPNFKTRVDEKNDNRRTWPWLDAFDYLTRSGREEVWSSNF